MSGGVDEYDVLVYPGFLRRTMARWNDDGSCAPMARARGPKGESFVLQLKQTEIDDDISSIESEVRVLTDWHPSCTQPPRFFLWEKHTQSGMSAVRFLARQPRAIPVSKVRPRAFKTIFVSTGCARLGAAAGVLRLTKLSVPLLAMSRFRWGSARARRARSKRR